MFLPQYDIRYALSATYTFRCKTNSPWATFFYHSFTGCVILRIQLTVCNHTHWQSSEWHKCIATTRGQISYFNVLKIARNRGMSPAAVTGICTLQNKCVKLINALPVAAK